MKTKKVFFGFRISPELLEQVRDKATKEDRTVSAVMERAIKESLNNK